MTGRSARVADVTYLPTALDLNPDDVLSGSVDEGYDGVVVIGEKDGEFFVHSHTSDMGWVYLTLRMGQIEVEELIRGQ